MKTDTGKLTEALSRHFGFSSFMEGQEEAVGHVLDGRDVVVIMPTGSGKSLCYQLSSMMLDGITLVVSPLIALMKDQVDGLLQKHIPTTFINSTLSAGEMRERLHGLQHGAYKLVYVAPERFRNQRFMDILEAVNVSMLAIDEAHCISQWGHDFRPDYLRINRVVEQLADTRVMALTATATPQVREDIADQLHLGRHGRPEPVTLVHGFARPNLHLKVTRASSHQEKLKRIRTMVADQKTGIIYCSTRKQTERVAAALKESDQACGIYHAGLTDEDRRCIQERFMSGEVDVVAATNAFGMGVDRADLRYVMHWDIPGSLEAYYQEVGRAGRDGKPAWCELLYNFADVRTQEFFMEGSNPKPEQVHQVWNVVRKRCHKHPVRATAEEWSGWVPEVKNDMAVRTILGILERSGLIERTMEPGDRIYTTGLVDGADLDQLEEQFFHMEKKRTADDHKLKSMLGYANAKRCRNAYILNYFGERSEELTCGHCDWCVREPGSEAREPTEEEWVVLQKILSCTARMRGRFGLSRVAQVLMGSKAKQILEWQLDRLPTYGILSDCRDAYIKAVMEALIHDGSLEITGDEFPLLEITDRGREVMRREQAVQMVWPGDGASGKGSRSKKASGTSKKSTQEAPASSLYDQDLFSRLKDWRKAQAQAESIPPYLIFHDRTLKSVAFVCPESHAQLESIVGVGPTKIQKYGDDLLDLIDQWRSESTKKGRKVEKD